MSAMLIIFLKFFAMGFGMAAALFFVAAIGSWLTDMPDRDRRIRSEGYDAAVFDFLHTKQYWDRNRKKYVDVDVKIEDEGGEPDE